ncbi:phospholipid carrier-dependent glycosyltransferase [Candidatus Microgenomates bacterium]|nr:MAG: phospholipid carrier-dependent glycosyltransferase [Candidatus Microgenomates bacterium]
MKKIILSLIFILALGLRVYRVSDFPAGPNLDEISQGYTAYSILKTGRDEWGEFLPFSPRAFGDYRAPLYTYLIIPSIAVFNLNEFALRFPAAVLGSLAVLVLYFLVKELFGDEKISLAASLLLAISPWHLPLSRGAFEASLHVFLFPLGMFLFLKGLKKHFWLFPSAVIFGLNLFSYYAPRLFTPLAVLLLVYFFRKEFFKKKANLGFIFVFGTLSLFAFFALLVGGTRVSDTSLLSPTDKWQWVANRQYEAAWNGLSPLVEKAFNNKVSFLSTVFYKQYLDYFSLSFLFSRGPAEATYGMIPGRGVLYLFELPLVFYGIYLLIKSKEKKQGVLVLALLLISPLSAALAKGERAANRAVTMLPLWQIVSAAGALGVLQYFQKYVSKKLLIFLFVAFSFVSLAFFLEDYFYHAPVVNAPSMSYGWKEASGYLLKESKNYDKIIVSRKLSEPQIAVAYFLKMEPKTVQQYSPEWLEYEQKGLLFVDQLQKYNLDKFEFRDFHFPEDQKLPNTLFVGKLEDFAGVKGEIKKKVYYPGPDQRIALIIMSFENEEGSN